MSTWLTSVIRIFVSLSKIALNFFQKFLSYIFLFELWLSDPIQYFVTLFTKKGGLICFIMSTLCLKEFWMKVDRKLVLLVCNFQIDKIVNSSGKSNVFDKLLSQIKPTTFIYYICCAWNVSARNKIDNSQIKYHILWVIEYL